MSCYLRIESDYGCVCFIHKGLLLTVQDDFHFIPSSLLNFYVSVFCGSKHIFSRVLWLKYDYSTSENDFF